MWIKEIAIPFLIQIFKEILGAQTGDGDGLNHKVALKISLALNIVFIAMAIFVIERFFVNAQRLSMEQAEVRKLTAIETQLNTNLKKTQEDVIYYRDKLDNCQKELKKPPPPSYEQPTPKKRVTVKQMTPKKGEKKLSPAYVQSLLDSINKS